MGKTLIVKEVTMPKFEPAPRSAQNNSGFSWADVILISPSGVTISALRTLSAANPYFRDRRPTPPLKLYPAMPTPGKLPANGANPWGAAAAITSANLAPAPAVTVRAEGSMATSFILEVSMSVPERIPEVRPCPVDCTAIRGARERSSERTAAATSVAVRGLTMWSGECGWSSWNPVIEFMPSQ